MKKLLLALIAVFTMSFATAQDMVYKVVALEYDGVKESAPEDEGDVTLTVSEDSVIIGVDGEGFIFSKDSNGQYTYLFKEILVDTGDILLVLSLELEKGLAYINATNVNGKVVTLTIYLEKL